MHEQIYVAELRGVLHMSRLDDLLCFVWLALISGSTTHTEWIIPSVPLFGNYGVSLFLGVYMKQIGYFSLF